MRLFRTLVLAVLFPVVLCVIGGCGPTSQAVPHEVRSEDVQKAYEFAYAVCLYVDSSNYLEAMREGRTIDPSMYDYCNDMRAEYDPCFITTTNFSTLQRPSFCRP